jgi:hypothetical protein
MERSYAPSTSVENGFTKPNVGKIGMKVELWIHVIDIDGRGRGFGYAPFRLGTAN